jgi:predicted glycogen debranching enzyme
MIELDDSVCSNFDESSSREWIETNGIGGYASSTIAGANTRRYHGLLIAATIPPVGLTVLLSKFEEILFVDGEAFELSCNQYPDVVHPSGFQYLTGFRLDPFPIWTYRVGGVELEKKVFMVHGENTTVVTWTVTKRKRSIKDTHLELKPLLAFRDHHHLRHEDPAFDGGFNTEEQLISIAPRAEMPRLYVAHNAQQIAATGHWYRDLEYAIERERGFDFREDLYQPFSLNFDLSTAATAIASTSVKNVDAVKALEKAEVKRRAMLVAKAGNGVKVSPQLVLAADQFIVSRGTGKTVIAGYPWFSDWGRDTMIALNGLTLATGRPEIAKSILAEFAGHISKGMLPNRFPDAGETPEYNTVDATLWYFEAIRAYAEKTGDFTFVRETLYKKLADIIHWHIVGTRFGIKLDTDGLLFAGEAGVQLTWMDSKIGDWVVTPRTGKPVEIQALWYNALRIMADFAVALGDADKIAEYSAMADTARKSFNEQFWNEKDQCLYDVVDGDEKDSSIRPNQIFAVSLPFTMLNKEKALKVVNMVDADLLTLAGLRSLSPADAAYVRHYRGSPFERDSSYHQGTVWGWLIGPFIDAFRKVHPDNNATRIQVADILKKFESQLISAMVGQVSEIFDAVPSHTPRGCPAQAWSVAELLRVSCKN